MEGHPKAENVTEVEHYLPPNGHHQQEYQVAVHYQHQEIHGNQHQEFQVEAHHQPQHFQQQHQQEFSDHHHHHQQQEFQVQQQQEFQVQQPQEFRVDTHSQPQEFQVDNHLQPQQQRQEYQIENHSQPQQQPQEVHVDNHPQQQPQEIHVDNHPQQHEIHVDNHPQQQQHEIHVDNHPLEQPQEIHVDNHPQQQPQEIHVDNHPQQQQQPQEYQVDNHIQPEQQLLVDESNQEQECQATMEGSDAADDESAPMQIHEYDEVDEKAPPKKRIRMRKPKFMVQWLEIPEFEDWLMEGVRPELAFCAYCDVSMRALKWKLKKHAESSKHMANSNFDPLDLPGDQDELDSAPQGNTPPKRVIDLRSDSISMPTRNMRLLMAKNWTGDTSFSTDTMVTNLEDFVCELLDKEKGLFFPSHDMANLVAILSHCQARGSTVYVGEESDINRNSKEALIKFGGVHVSPLVEYADGTFDLDALEMRLKHSSTEFPLTTLVSFECPHFRKGGRVPSLSWIKNLGAIRESMWPPPFLLHCDGARLFGASVHANVDVTTLVSSCDSVTFAIDKGLAAPLGAVVVGSNDFIRRASYIRRFIGGHIHQAGIFASACLLGIKKGLRRIEMLHEKASSIAKGIHGLESTVVRTDPENVHTNVILLQCPQKHLTARGLKYRLEKSMAGPKNAFVPIRCGLIDDSTLSMTVHTGISIDDVATIVSKVRCVVNNLETDDKHKGLRSFHRYHVPPAVATESYED